MEKSKSDNFKENVYDRNEHYRNSEFIILSSFKSSVIKIILKDRWGYHRMNLNSLLKGSKPSIKSAIFPLNYLKNKLSETHIDFKYSNYRILKYNDFENIEVQTPFGVVVTNISNLYRGTQLGIGSSPNKTEYALNYLNYIHRNKYKILPFVFKNSKQYLRVVCPIHGEFKITYDCFKYRSCPKCGNASRKKYSISDFFEKYYNKYPCSPYNYEKFKYINSHFKTVITCLKHGDFLQTPSNHMNGQGCPKCSSENKPGGMKWWLNTKGKIGTLYILKCYNPQEEFVKIGITSKNIKERYRSKKLMPYEYEILKQYEYSNKQIPFLLEKHLLEKFKAKKYIPNISFGGSKKECFRIRIETVEKEIKKWLN